MKKLIKKFEGGGEYSNADMYKKAYDKLKSLGYPPEMLDITLIRNLGGVDAIMSSSFNQRYISPEQRQNQEIEAAGGLEAWLKLKRSEAWNNYQRNKRASREQGDVARDERKMTPEEAKAVYDYNMRVLLLIADQYNNTHAKTAKQRTTTKTQSTQTASTTKSTNTQTANQGFNVKAFQNWVLQRNKFNNSRGFTNGNYSLGRYGADGIMGRYTRNAYNALKNEYNMWLKSGMNNYGLFYNKYIYKNPQDISDRMADDNEMIIQNQITMTPELEVQPINGLSVPPEYTHDDWIRGRMGTMNSYNTTPTPLETDNYYSRPSDMINMRKTTAFAFGGRLIPKYDGGGWFAELIRALGTPKKSPWNVGNINPIVPKKQLVTGRSINPKYVSRTSKGFLVNPEGINKVNSVPYLPYYIEKGNPVYVTKDGLVTVNPTLSPIELQIVAGTYRTSSKQSETKKDDEVSNNDNKTNKKSKTKMDETTQLPLTAELMWNYLLGNDELMKLFKMALGIPEQTTDDKTKPVEPDKNAAPALTNIPKAPTYEDLVALNTAAFNNGINNAGWRRNFRKEFNTAVQNGTLYDKYNPSGSGTSVFDTNVTWGFDNNNNPQRLDASSILSVFAGDDGQLSRREMRRMRKWTKNAAPLQAKQNALDFLRHGQISMIGINDKLPGLQEVKPLEPERVNPWNETSPYKPLNGPLDKNNTYVQ